MRAIGGELFLCEKLPICDEMLGALSGYLCTSVEAAGTAGGNSTILKLPRGFGGLMVPLANEAVDAQLSATLGGESGGAPRTGCSMRVAGGSVTCVRIDIAISGSSSEAVDRGVDAGSECVPCCEALNSGLVVLVLVNRF